MLTNIPSSTLKQLVRLSERKEALMAQIQEIDREMIRVQNKFGIPSRDTDQRAPVTVSRAPGLVRRRSKRDRKSTRLNSSHLDISYAVFCLKKKNRNNQKSTSKHSIFWAEACSNFSCGYDM